MNDPSSKAMLLALLLASVVQPATAHHSVPVNFDQSEITIEGVLTDIKWVNPHAHFRVNVIEAGGCGRRMARRNGRGQHHEARGLSHRTVRRGRSRHDHRQPGPTGPHDPPQTVLKDGTRMTPTMRPRTPDGAGSAN